MKKLAGIVLGLSLLMPTLHYEADLFERVAAAMDGGAAISLDDVRPPVDADAAFEKLASVFD